MRILSNKQIKELEAQTLQSQKITEIELMEVAGSQLFRHIDHKLKGSSVPIHVFCGIGNNGGDGLVLARHLKTHGYHIEVYVVNYSEKRSKGFLHNYDRYKEVANKWPQMIKSVEECPVIRKEDIVIDAIFGIGINRNPAKWVSKLFGCINESLAFIIAIDVPSGMFLDKAVKTPNDLIHANYTFTLGVPKMIFYLKETHQFCGFVEVVEIGFDIEYLMKMETEGTLVRSYSIIPFYRSRRVFSDKSDYGHALIIGGSYGKIGAPLMASNAAMHSGAGWVSAYLPDCGVLPAQTSFPEIMVHPDKEEKYISQINYSDLHINSIAIGMGMGTNQKTIDTFEEFLKKIDKNKALLIDADGINILAQHKDWIKLLPENTIITPHEAEFRRLVGLWKNDFEMMEKAFKFSLENNIIIVLKGAFTKIFFRGKCFVNTTGNPGMAIAGMGDVLSGTIAGLCAQGYNPLEASIMGVYIHGRAGDIYSTEGGFEQMNPKNICKYYGDAITELIKEMDGGLEDEGEEKEER